MATNDVLYDHSVANSNATMNDSVVKPYWPMEFRIPFAIIMVVIWIFSFFGNLLVLAVIIRFKGMRTRTNLFIANLALVDFLTALLCMPFSLTTIALGEWIFSDTFCQINGFLMPLVFITSVHTLMYISLHKHFTITNPFKTVLTRRIVFVMIFMTWFVALLLAIVDIYGLNHVEFKHYTTQCGPAYPKGLKGYLHNALMTLTTYVIPFGVMIFSYARMFKEIIAYSKRLEQHSSVERSSILNTQKKAACTLFIVVICFLLCWTPYLAYATYGSAVKDKSKIPRWLNPVCYWFGYLNSALNPIIYGMRNKSFSTGYRRIACCCLGQVSSPGPDEGSKVFIWTRKRSSSGNPDVARQQSTSSRQSGKNSDASLPIVIRKNGKIIRIEEAPKKRATRNSSVDTIHDYDVISRNGSQKSQKGSIKKITDETVDEGPENNNSQQVLVDDVIIEEPNDVINAEIPKVNTNDPADSGNDSDMSESPRNSTNKNLLQRSKSDHETSKKRKSDLFSSFRKSKNEPTPPHKEVQFEFLTMDPASLDKSIDSNTSLPLTGPGDVISLPSIDNLDSDVMMSSDVMMTSGDGIFHTRHSTPKQPKNELKAFRHDNVDVHV